MMEGCDLDGDGKINYHEFLTAASKYTKLASKQNIKKVFDVLDYNKDGFIDGDEFEYALPAPMMNEVLLGSSDSTLVEG